jgi:hypothetical protein
MEGTGIEVPCPEDGGEPIIGFFTTRLVKARTVDEAEGKAKEMVLSDWTVGEYASINQGGTPALKVDTVYSASWWQSLKYKNTGHTFYTENEPAESGSRGCFSPGPHTT